MTYDHLIDRIDELKLEMGEALARISVLKAERDEALRDAAQSHAQELMAIDLANEWGRERDELRHRLDMMAATMFPIETPKGDA